MGGTVRTPFFRAFDEAVESLGGMFNAHLHLDRYGTLADHYMADASHQILPNSHVSLQKKHYLINALHSGPAYEQADLRQRVNECLDAMVACNTRRADTLVDVTADRVGLSALYTMKQIQAERYDIELRLGAYSPLGFRDDEPARWDVFEQGVRSADFLASLPEADDTDDYPANIGFEENCRRMLALAREVGKPIHVHTDQRNESSEAGTERLIQVLRDTGGHDLGDGDPSVWVVHMISPTTYEPSRFDALVEGLVEQGVGVIVCPSAAIGMRQLRPLRSYTDNCIPRVLELLQGGVHVRLASDNIADICSPSTTADLTDEVLVLSAAVRYYGIDLLARLAAGERPSARELEALNVHLAKNALEIEKVLDARSARTTP